MTNAIDIFTETLDEAFADFDDAQPAEIVDAELVDEPQFTHSSCSTCADLIVVQRLDAEALWWRGRAARAANWERRLASMPTVQAYDAARARLGLIHG